MVVKTLLSTFTAFSISLGSLASTHTEAPRIASFGVDGAGDAVATTDYGERGGKDAEAEGERFGDLKPTEEARKDAESEPGAPRPRSTGASAREAEGDLDRRLLHGFRLGYSFIANADQPAPHDPDQTVKESLGLASAHLFVVGYEAFYRMVGHDWLNVILVGNVSIAGLEQSTVLPRANGLLGFEFDESFQLGLGVNLTADEHKPTHMVAAAGWTPKVGDFYVPVHFHLIPDIDGNHRAGTTIGVNW